MEHGQWPVRSVNKLSALVHPQNTYTQYTHIRSYITEHINTNHIAASGSVVCMCVRMFPAFYELSHKISWAVPIHGKTLTEIY